MIFSGQVQERTGVTLRLLGGWQLENSGTTLRSSQTIKRLLAVLALRGQLHRNAVAAQLWPDSPPAKSAGSLRELLFRLRRSHPQTIQIEWDLLRLDPSIGVDVHELNLVVRQLARGVAPATPALPLLTAGHLLPEWDGDWVCSAREHIRQTQLCGLELLAEQQLSLRLYHEAIQTALAAVAQAPLLETAQRIIVRAHLAMGNYGEAAAQFERYSDHLDCELGVRPSREFAGLLRDRVRDSLEDNLFPRQPSRTGRTVPVVTLK